MGKRGFTTEQMIVKLRKAVVLLVKCEPVGQVCRKKGVSEQMHYRCRREYGGMRVDQAKRLKEVDHEDRLA